MRSSSYLKIRRKCEAQPAADFSNYTELLDSQIIEQARMSIAYVLNTLDSSNRANKLDIAYIGTEVVVMYNKITNATLDIFATPTREYFGRSSFDLTPEAESKLLDLLNYNVMPDSLVLLNVKLFKPPINYVIPVPFKNYRLEAIISANARSAGSDFITPITIQLQFDMRGRGKAHGNLYEYDSMELSNIKVLNVK